MDNQFEDTAINELCKIVKDWKAKQDYDPTREDIIFEYASKGLSDADSTIDRAIKAGVVEEVNSQIVLLDFGEEVVKNG